MSWNLKSQIFDIIFVKQNTYEVQEMYSLHFDSEWQNIISYDNKHKRKWTYKTKLRMRPCQARAISYCHLIPASATSSPPPPPQPPPTSSPPPHQGSKNRLSLVWLGRVIFVSTPIAMSSIPDTFYT